MATPDLIEFDRLLAPIADDAPAGSDVREDFSPQSPYFAIKDAQAQARTAERKRREAFEDVPDTDFHPDEWEPVLQLAEEILCEKAKDLEVAAWYLEALLRQHGFAGLRDGLRLLREMIERYWEEVFPRPDEDGLATVVAPIAALNGEDGPGTLIWPISNIPLTGVQPWGGWQYREAQSFEGLESDEIERRVQEGGVTVPMFDAAVSETPIEFFRDLVQDVDQVQEELRQLTRLLEDRCGLDDSGYPIAPSTTSIEEAVAEVLQAVRALTSGLDLEPEPEPEVAPDPGQPAAASAKDSNTAALPSSGGAMTREQAFKSIQQLADYFKKTEPHSPTAYLLEKAVRWGKLPFPRLMRELVADEPTLSELYRVMGIGGTTEEDGGD